MKTVFWVLCLRIHWFAHLPDLDILILKENVDIFLKNCKLTFYAIIFGQGTFFSMIKLDFRGKREFYLFYYNAFFEDRVLFK